MQIESINILGQSRLMRDYRKQKSEIMNFFDYKSTDYHSRLMELQSRTFRREELVEVLTQLNKGWDAPKATMQNINRLKNEKSVVVIGGQQAGLLTGPLYSVNKVISIIQLAKQQEERLGIPVIPVFWIAGEDHDFEEINHVYMDDWSRMKKYKIGQQVYDKRPVSQIEIDKSDMSEWLHTVLEQLSETNYTNTIKASIHDCLLKSSSYVDFFARLLFTLFDQEGVVLIDSGNDMVRKLESDYFVQLIEKQESISAGVYHSLQELTKRDYSIDLEVTKEDGHLFIQRNNERILLRKNQEGNWHGKQNEIVLTTKELLEIATNEPEKLSNNVMSRPIMQDLVFPTLAFVGGPGEIAYWAVLKSAFHALNINMPPVVPRLSFTYIDRKTEKTLQKYDITLDLALNGHLAQKRADWFTEKIDPPIEETVAEIKATITKAHEPLRHIAKEIRSDMNDLAEKNLSYVMREIDFLKNRIIRAVEEQYDKELTELSTLENLLYPGGLQERVWNPLPFINKYGMDFFQRVTTNQFSFEQNHYVIYI